MVHLLTCRMLLLLLQELGQLCLQVLWVARVQVGDSQRIAVLVQHLGVEYTSIPRALVLLVLGIYLSLHCCQVSLMVYQLALRLSVSSLFKIDCSEGTALVSCIFLDLLLFEQLSTERLATALLLVLLGLAPRLGNIFIQTKIKLDVQT